MASGVVFFEYLSLQHGKDSFRKVTILPTGDNSMRYVGWSKASSSLIMPLFCFQGV
jgi:hypothetical protein